MSAQKVFGFELSVQKVSIISNKLISNSDHAFTLEINHDERQAKHRDREY